MSQEENQQKLIDAIDRLSKQLSIHSSAAANNAGAILTRLDGIDLRLINTESRVTKIEQRLNSIELSPYR